MSIPFDVMNARHLRAYWQSVITGGNENIVKTARYNYCGACEILVKDVSSVKAAKAVQDEADAAYKAVLDIQAKILPKAQEAYTAVYDAVKTSTDDDIAAADAASSAFDEVMKEYARSGPDNYFAVTRANKAYEDWQVAVDEAFVSLYGV
jgi:hypothetical protein